jgi:uncharacterized membrane protein YkvA (DUF1232 family)
MMRQAQAFEAELRAVYYVTRDPRVPWLARVVAAAAIGYQFSPIQVIPDWIPVIGFADNVCALAIAAALVRRTTPHAVLAECRERAAAEVMRRAQAKPGVARLTMACTLVAWFLAAALVSVLAVRLLW